MDGKEGIKRVTTFCSVCGLAVSIFVGELGEIYEGKAMKEHSHAHYHYQHLGQSVYLVSGTSASAATITGGTLGIVNRGI